MIIIAISIIVSIFTTIFLRNRKLGKEKILNVYSSPGKWYLIKYLTMLILFQLRNLSSKLKPGKAGIGYGTKKLEDIEKLQPLSQEKKAFDAVFYQGVNSSGYYFAGGIERRPNSKVNGLVYLLVPELGLLESESLPKTELNADETENSFAGGGISFTPVVPMKKWDIYYKGRMWLGPESNKTWYNVELKAEFTSDMPHFVVDSDADKKCLARAIARETWTKEFFKTLEKSHQTHYEQMGNITGKVIINEKEHILNLQGFRDHSFGHQRDWTLLHRYIFHMLYLENDVRICIGVISQPCTISHFEIGYVLNPKTKEIHPVQRADLKLYQHGEDGEPPKSIAFTFNANDDKYDCKIDYLPYNGVHYKGNDIEAKLIERFFVGEVNGVKCRGVSEWHYNNVGTYTK
ncbi:uncharacterized protein [Onthophagus taurus]|uniref:uncharacterized protein n=1 Tax=Onthophagus taurus TaxID=166361 RepID=UPI000C20C6A9|nr:uncharacterized protein LOC111428631 [Onthophagus taurus]